MKSLPEITVDYVAENFKFYKKEPRYHSGIQSLVYEKMCYNTINYRYKNEENMPYTILVKQLNDISVILTSFVKDTQGISTVNRIKQTFRPSILKIHLQCLFTTLGLAIDLCTRVRDEKMIAIEFLSNGWEIDFDCDLILEYKKIRYPIFDRNRKNALLFKEALGKKINEITLDEEALSGGNPLTRFKVNEISIRNEQNGSRKSFFPKMIGGLKIGQKEYFYLADGRVTKILMKSTPVYGRKYVSGVEFYGVNPNKCGQVCHYILDVFRVFTYSLNVQK